MHRQRLLRQPAQQRQRRLLPRQEVPGLVQLVHHRLTERTTIQRIRPRQVRISSRRI